MLIITNTNYSSFVFITTCCCNSKISGQYKPSLHMRRALDPFITENVKRKVSVAGSDPKAIKRLFLEELNEEVNM